MDFTPDYSRFKRNVQFDINIIADAEFMNHRISCKCVWALLKMTGVLEYHEM